MSRKFKSAYDFYAQERDKDMIDESVEDYLVDTATLLRRQGQFKNAPRLSPPLACQASWAYKRKIDSTAGVAGSPHSQESSASFDKKICRKKGATKAENPGMYRAIFAVHRNAAGTQHKKDAQSYQERPEKTKLESYEEFDCKVPSLPESVDDDQRSQTSKNIDQRQTLNTTSAMTRLWNDPSFLHYTGSHCFHYDQSSAMDTSMFAPIHQISATAEMKQRWNDLLRTSIPAIDFSDVAAQRSQQGQFGFIARQNMPEIAQQVYNNMLFDKDRAVGEYPALPENSIKVTEQVRVYMITVIVELHRIKNYKEETLYLACSIADRYCVALIEYEIPSPCLIQLAFVSTLIAAKLEEPLQPSFSKMVRLAQKEWNFATSRQDLIDLEAKVVHLLDFELLKPGPLFFLERFQRLMGLENEKEDEQAAQVSKIARKMIRCILLSSTYLRYRASEIAASSLLLSMSICMSPSALLMEASRAMPDLSIRPFYQAETGYSNDIYQANSPKSFQSAAASTQSLQKSQTDLGTLWNYQVESVTSLGLKEHILPCLAQLFELVNDTERVRGQFAADQILTAILKVAPQHVHPSP